MIKNIVTVIILELSILNIFFCGVEYLHIFVIEKVKQVLSISWVLP